MKLNSKKIILIFLFIVTLFIVFNPVVDASTIDYEDLCGNYEDGLGKVSIILGEIVRIVKIVIPILIIVFGMVDFGKAVISNDDKALSKATSSIIRRIIAGVLVFFMPTIILSLLNLTGVVGDTYSNIKYGECTRCVLDVSLCK